MVTGGSEQRQIRTRLKFPQCRIVFLKVGHLRSRKHGSGGVITPQQFREFRFSGSKTEDGPASICGATLPLLQGGKPDSDFCFSDLGPFELTSNVGLKLTDQIGNQPYEYGLA